MLKNFLAVLGGVASAILLVMICEWLDWYLYPMPPGLDPQNPQAVKELMAHMPIGAFLCLLGGYAIASFGGGLVATLISGRATGRAALITGAVVTFAGIMNLCMLPHPLWFTVINVLEYIPFAFLGYLVVRKPPVEGQ